MSEIDRARVAEFMERFVEMAAGATTMALLAIADRTGILEWMRSKPAANSDEIAEGAGLEGRYVREVLSGLAAAGVVEYSPADGSFALPAEHALFVADESSPYFMGGWFDIIPAAMTHLDEIVKATREGGGVAYDEYGKEMVAAIERGNRPSQSVFLTGRWLGAVDGLMEALEEGIQVVDIGCGTGTAARLIAEAFPASHVTGYDSSEQSIEAARAAATGISNLEYRVGRIEELSEPGRFGLVTSFDVIHDVVDPRLALVAIRESMSPDGWYLMMEPAASSDLANNLHKHGALQYGISTLLCLTQSLAAGGAGLGAAWGEESARDLAVAAGFSQFEKLDGISNRFSNFYLLQP